MTPRSLDGWLDWQQALHPAQIDLGLDRVRDVLQRMSIVITCPVLTVAGTNGKGTTVACAEAIARASGVRTATYTSPHLVRYTERLHLAGVEVGERVLCEAFEAVEAARGETPLTYFEFGTLGVLHVIQAAAVDLAILEVGMGGRLDAVNVIDPQVAIVTSIGLDHQDWLGTDRESIGLEKAGVFRAGSPAICAEPSPPASLIEYAEGLGAELCLLGREFDAEVTGAGWRYFSGDLSIDGLRIPGAGTAAQARDAAAALAALLRSSLGGSITTDAVRAGLAEADIPGRYTRFGDHPTLIADVAHNPDAAAVLAAALGRDAGAGRTLMVLGMLDDKDLEGFAAALSPVVDAWYPADLGLANAMASTQIERRLKDLGYTGVRAASGDVEKAFATARSEAGAADRVVVAGSFHAVGALGDLGLYCGHPDGRRKQPQ